MTVFNEFDTNGKFLGKKEDSINETNIEQFIAAFGQERAIGYFQAVNDILNELTSVRSDWVKGIGGTMYPANRVRANLEVFFIHKNELLKTIIEKFDFDIEKPVVIKSNTNVSSKPE